MGLAVIASWSRMRFLNKAKNQIYVPASAMTYGNDDAALEATDSGVTIACRSHWGCA